MEAGDHRWRVVSRRAGAAAQEAPAELILRRTQQGLILPRQLVVSRLTRGKRLVGLPPSRDPSAGRDPMVMAQPELPSHEESAAVPAVVAGLPDHLGEAQEVPPDRSAAEAGSADTPRAAIDDHRPPPSGPPDRADETISLAEAGERLQLGGRPWRSHERSHPRRGGPVHQDSPGGVGPRHRPPDLE